MSALDRKRELAIRLFHRVFPSALLKEDIVKELERRELPADQELRMRGQLDAAIDHVADDIASEWARTRSEEAIAELLARTDSPFFNPRAISNDEMLGPLIRRVSEYFKETEVVH